MAELQLAEILAALSQVTDLSMGQPPESAIRICLLATGLARRMDLPEREVADVYYTVLLQHIYTKLGVSTRAGAALFAMEHDLINRPVSEK